MKHIALMVAFLAAPACAAPGARRPLELGYERPGVRFSPAVFDAAARPLDGSLTRWSRLAGMFMGRVSALTVGEFKVCFDLDLRS